MLNKKVCTKCKVEKEITEFYKRPETPDGRKYHCRACDIEYNRKYVNRERKKVNEWRRASYNQLTDKTRYLMSSAKRRATKRSAVTNWDAEIDELVLLEAYSLAKLRTEMLGIEYAVDHIVPLISSIVCGLHNAYNIQVIPSSINCSKNNRYWPDMPETTQFIKVRYDHIRF
jgi:transposase-like protein